MKRYWTLLLLLVSTAVILVACSNDQAAEAVAPAQVQNPAVPNAASTNDLSLIGASGRPQFLNAYASW